MCSRTLPGTNWLTGLPPFESENEFPAFVTIVPVSATAPATPPPKADLLVARYRPIRTALKYRFSISVAISCRDEALKSCKIEIRYRVYDIKG